MKKGSEDQNLTGESEATESTSHQGHGGAVQRKVLPVQTPQPA